MKKIELIGIEKKVKEDILGKLESNSELIKDKECLKQILEVEKILNEKIVELKQKEINMIRVLEEMEDIVEKNILELRFILNKTWEEIAERVGYSVGHLHRIKNRAIKNFYKLLEELERKQEFEKENK